MSKRCRWCKEAHDTAFCDRVKTVEFYSNGQVKRVEFFDSVSRIVVVKEYVQPAWPFIPVPTYPSYPVVTCSGVLSETSSATSSNELGAQH